MIVCVDLVDVVVLIRVRSFFFSNLWSLRLTQLLQVVFVLGWRQQANKVDGSFTDPIITCLYQPIPWIWPGTAAAFIGAGIFGQHMTSLGPKAPYFLSNALLVEFLGQTATWECMIYTNKQVVVLKLFCSITWGIDTTRWWFQIFYIFTPIWGRFPFWLIFFKGGWNHQLATVWENDSETSALLLCSWEFKVLLMKRTTGW